MIRSKLGVCGESVVRDVETNAISVFNILEDITAASFPATVPKLSALFILERDDSDPEQLDCLVTVRLNGEEFARVPLVMDFEGKLRNRLILVGEGVVLNSAGLLTMELEVDSTILSVWTIPVTESVPKDKS